MIISIAALLAAAQGWHASEQTIQVMTAERSAREQTVPVVMPEGAEGPTPILICRNGKMGLMMTIDDTDPMKAIDRRLERRRAFYGTISVDGQEVYSGRFPKLGRSLIDADEVAVEVFNAVVRGQAVTLKSQGRGEKQLPLPPTDDAFATFAAQCKAQRKA